MGCRNCSQSSVTAAPGDLRALSDLRSDRQDTHTIHMVHRHAQEPNTLPRDKVSVSQRKRCGDDNCSCHRIVTYHLEKQALPGGEAWHRRMRCFIRKVSVTLTSLESLRHIRMQGQDAGGQQRGPCTDGKEPMFTRGHSKSCASREERL